MKIDILVAMLCSVALFIASVVILLGGKWSIAVIIFAVSIVMLHAAMGMQKRELMLAAARDRVQNGTIAYASACDILRLALDGELSKADIFARTDAWIKDEGNDYYTFHCHGQLQAISGAGIDAMNSIQAKYDALKCQTGDNLVSMN